MDKFNSLKFGDLSEEMQERLGEMAVFVEHTTEEIFDLYHKANPTEVEFTSVVEALINLNCYHLLKSFMRQYCDSVGGDLSEIEAIINTILALQRNEGLGGEEYEIKKSTGPMLS